MNILSFVFREEITNNIFQGKQGNVLEQGATKNKLL